MKLLSIHSKVYLNYNPMATIYLSNVNGILIKQYKKRNFKESKEFLLKNLGKSITLRSKIYTSFEIYFKDFLENE